ncbi:ketopantoate reductase family protein [Azospirillum sp. 412522]|nr:ketopantoate reductase family protein [Azospirillum sp. 412522]MBY6264937.1 ketopantoate reductase family protein [Azospirillum sp. 412522]
MKVCIVGAGALGSTIGGTLAAGGCDVCLIDSHGAHVDAINRSGLRILEGDRERTVAVGARKSAEGLGPVDLVIVLVKSFHTEAAVAAAAPAIGPETLVMSLQNGLGHEDIIAGVVGRGRVLAGKTYVGGVFLGPGHVRSGVAGKETVIGELDGGSSERVERIAAAMNAAGLLTIVSPNIMGTMWDKLLINVAGGALTAITRLTYGGLYSLPVLEECALAAVAEAMAVARAGGVQLSMTDPREAWDKASAGLPAEFKTSMLQSLSKGEATEVDFIHGSVVRWGARCGVPTPVNSTLVACVKGIEYAATDYPGKA